MTRRCVAGLLALAFVACGDHAKDDAQPSPPRIASAADAASNAGSLPPPKYPQAHPEAGHLEVPGHVTGPTSRARMFYAFRPADVEPENAPLLVIFNGGPGWATSRILLPYGTGPFTLVAASDAGASPQPNPASWTRFANLLYLDDRLTGYSYGLDSTACSPNRLESDVYMADAGDFVHALLDFLDGHEPYRDNRVVITGESYGGTRAVLMNYLIQHYAEPPAKLDPKLPDAKMLLPWLRDRVQAHVDVAFPALRGLALGADAVAKAQFGHQVMIEGNFAGVVQYAIEDTFYPNDKDLKRCFAQGRTCNRWDVRKTLEETYAIDAHTATAMRDPKTLETLLGVAATSVEGFAPNARVGAVRNFDTNTGSAADVAAKEALLRSALGPLSANDAYWLPYGLACPGYLGDLDVLAATVEVMSRTATFATRAKFDCWVYGDAYPTLFAKITGTTATIIKDQPNGAVRPGLLEVRNAGVFSAPVMVRFPKYEAGHSITMDQGAELGADIEDWLRSVGVLH